MGITFSAIVGHFAIAGAIWYTICMDNLITLLAVIAGYFMGNSNARAIATQKAITLIDTITKRNQIKVLHKREPKSTDDERAEQIAQHQGVNIPPNA